MPHHITNMPQKRHIDKQKVYDYLAAIPAGKVVTYGQIAQHLGDKRFSRAVGAILHQNPDGEKYPCYKVVSTKGELSPGYAFGGLEAQKARLLRDHIVVENNRVDLNIYQYIPK